MSLSNDLLEQAQHLARREPKRPRQASLRRAVSAAYYSLFHLLTDEACRFLVSGSANNRDALRHALRRSFGHGDMKKLSIAFRGGTAPREWRHAGIGAIPPDLRVVAESFVDLQEARHEADYDMAKVYRRQEVLELVVRCQEARIAWNRVKGSPWAETYLVALLANRQLKS